MKLNVLTTKAGPTNKTGVDWSLVHIFCILIDVNASLLCEQYFARYYLYIYKYIYCLICISSTFKERFSTIINFAGDLIMFRKSCLCNYLIIFIALFLNYSLID